MNIMLFCKIKLFNLGLISILEATNGVNKLSLVDNLSSLKNIKEKSTIIIVLEERNSALLDLIEELTENSYVNILIIDLIGSKKIIEKLVKLPIMGYLVSTASLDDINFALSKIKNGDKYYHSSVTDILLNSTIPCNITKLSKREEEILKELSEGNSNAEISYNLNISENTVKKHISSIFQKINCKDRVQAALYAKELLL